MTTRQEKAAQTRRDLLAAAQVVFERKGYLNATITDITTEAGKAAGSFYNHFDGKEALLLALAGDIGDDADALIATSPGRSAGPRPASRRVLATPVRTVMAALRDAALVDPAFAQRMHDFGIEQMKPWAELLTALAEGIAALTRFVERGLLG